MSTRFLSLIALVAVLAASPLLAAGSELPIAGGAQLPRLAGNIRLQWPS